MKRLIAAFLVGLVGNAEGADPITVTTKDGRTVRAEVLGLEAGVVHLKVFGFGGDATVKRGLDVFIPESIYRIELRAAAPTTFEQHFAMARRAAELDLLPQAGVQARAAVDAAADPDGDAKRQQVHAWAADALEQMIAAAVTAGDLDRANDCLHILATKLADQRTEEQLAKLAEQVDSLRKAAVAKVAAERSAKTEARKRTEIERKLEPIRKSTAEGDKFLSKAISQSGNTASSAQSCEHAVGAYKNAWKAAKELAAAHLDDADLQNELGAMIDELEQSALQAAMHAANVLTRQTDYRAATEWVNRVLKYDPDNADAKAMQRTIELAAADSANYRYGWRRRR